ncbi:unnamed protein product [Boreogadus saida]
MSLEVKPTAACMVGPQIPTKALTIRSAQTTQREAKEEQDDRHCPPTSLAKRTESVSTSCGIPPVRSDQIDQVLYSLVYSPRPNAGPGDPDQTSEWYSILTRPQSGTAY